MIDNKLYPPLIWLDLEMTGLDPNSERIIEIATVVTSGDLEEVNEGPNLVIKQPKEFINGMDEWNKTHHSNSGLLDCLKVTQVSEVEAEKQTLDFLKKHASKGKSPLCGNSISHDRRFLVRYMPELANFFHYRNIDVSTVKELVKRWRPDLLEIFTKLGAHRAMTDVYESIEELRFYKKNFLNEELNL